MTPAESEKMRARSPEMLPSMMPVRMPEARAPSAAVSPTLLSPKPRGMAPERRVTPPCLTTNRPSGAWVTECRAVRVPGYGPPGGIDGKGPGGLLTFPLRPRDRDAFHSAVQNPGNHTSTRLEGRGELFFFLIPRFNKS